MNRFRNEATIELAGNNYTMRMTLGALAEIEEALQANDLIDLSKKLSSGTMRTKELIAIIAAGLRGGGAKLSNTEVASLLPASDVTKYIKVIVELLSQAFMSEEVNKKKEQDRMPFK